ncbi:3'-5' exonuclease [Streptomyces goshikiensis]|uniref:3'-5' exonuclease n=1 Tax=Streptomyces goshikiensis TaxID=1942 RepID=UPI0036BA1F1B
MAAMDRLHAEGDADVTVSTAHRAKGREWPTVRIANDFQEPVSNECDLEGNSLPGAISLDDARLAYVAVTRAREHLDLGGLAWIDKHPQGRSSTPPAALGSPDRAVTAAASPWDRLRPTPAPPGRAGRHPALTATVGRPDASDALDGRSPGRRPCRRVRRGPGPPSTSTPTSDGTAPRSTGRPPTSSTGRRSGYRSCNPGTAPTR